MAKTYQDCGRTGGWDGAGGGCRGREGAPGRGEQVQVQDGSDDVRFRRRALQAHGRDPARWCGPGICASSTRSARGDRTSGCRAGGSWRKGSWLKMRFELDQYINLRPVAAVSGRRDAAENKGPQDIDFVVVREKFRRRLHRHRRVFTMKGTPTRWFRACSRRSTRGSRWDRCLKYAFEYARKSARGPPPGREEHARPVRQRRTSLTYIYGLWERAFHEMGQAPVSRHLPASTTTSMRRPCGS